MTRGFYVHTGPIVLTFPASRSESSIGVPGIDWGYRVRGSLGTMRETPVAGSLPGEVMGHTGSAVVWRVSKHCLITKLSERGQIREGTVNAERSASATVILARTL
jgi:hypothetical protein